ncbi:transposase DDE domain protein [Leptospira kirschneri str. H2]|nr:transposase DDE domain protein [Leptospira kirschneri str. H2]
MQLDYSDNVNWSFGTRCKVFKDIAQRGKSSTGWFYGFKLHLIINDQGELLSFMKPPGNVDDMNLKVIFPLVKNRVVEKFHSENS